MISPETIEKKALEVGARLGIGEVSSPDMYYVLQKLEEKISKFRFKPALSAEMGHDEAWMDDDSQTLTARESVLEDAKAGRARARFTIAHELGHYFLGHKGRPRRNPNKDVYLKAEERIQENEANLFASFLLVPTHLAYHASNAEEITACFQVSGEVAEIAFERIQSTKRKKTATKRRPPDCVIDFLKEAKSRGRVIRSEIAEFE